MGVRALYIFYLSDYTFQGETAVDEPVIEAGDETGRRLGNGSAETRGMGR